MPMQVMLRAGTAGSVSRVTQEELRRLLADLGFAEVRSLLRSGNLVFRGDGPTGPELERELEHAVQRRYDGAVHLFCRTEEEWKAVVARNPFREEVVRDPGQLVVMFLKQAPPDARLAALQNIRLGPERSGADGKQLYVLYPNGAAGSHLTRTLVEHRQTHPSPAEAGIPSSRSGGCCTTSPRSIAAMNPRLSSLRRGTDDMVPRGLRPDSTAASPRRPTGAIFSPDHDRTRPLPLPCALPCLPTNTCGTRP
ncbi:MAG: DUF1697 domain-containing protein [Gemmatimonadota bacterium]|nr:DUF1697 domain-containing protein [Gemmatimonadota bacterium]